MKRVYYVVIKGKTLEDRNLKELLARAVSEKRKMRLQVQAYGNRVGNSASPASAA